MLSIYGEIKEEMEQLELELGKVVGSADPLINDVCVHMIKAGGKRLRPALCFLGGKFHQYDYRRLMPMAVALELVHMATLVHDDVVDASMVRRGVPTVKALWGNRISVNIGDYLFSKSTKLVTSYENREIYRLLAQVSMKMCEGEIHQLSNINNPGIKIKDYLYRINRKTALLISASCQLGAVISGASNGIASILKSYGHYTGMAFQIADDLLDLQADQEKLGKPVGSDLRQGVLNLPVIYALNKSPRKDILAGLVSGEDKSDEDIDRACRLVRESGALEYARDMAGRYVGRALRLLSRLPAIPAREHLAGVAEFIIKRKF